MSDSSNSLNILRIDASMRHQGSVSRQLTDELIAKVGAEADVTVQVRDLTNGIALIDEDWIAANFTPHGDRSEEQRAKLSFSDSLVDELRAADIVVIGTPIYNFGVPAALKAWVDMVCRARVTFEYGQNGPKGLLKGKKAYLIIASGGTNVGSEIDFATDYMKHVLGFIGIDDVRIINAGTLIKGADEVLDRARTQIEASSIELKAA
jgi:FMN-dependent NADH-azoreductase